MQKMTFCARLYLALGAVRGRQALSQIPIRIPTLMQIIL